MTDRTYSPSGWGGVPVTPGQHVLPGADLGREVPLPPQPPLEDESTLCGCAHCRQPGHVEDGRGNVWQKCSPTCDMQIVRPGKVQCSCDAPAESPDLPIPEEAGEAAAAFSETYGYPADARYAAESALIAAGLVDPDDGTVPHWRRGDKVPVWTNPMHVVDTVLAAALPHLRSLQVETQVAFGRALGRKEAAEEIATRLDRIVENVGHAVGPKEFEVGAGAVLGSYRHAAQIARGIGKGDLMTDATEPACANHHPVQHRDGKEPWCKECKRTASGEEPRSRLRKD